LRAAPLWRRPTAREIRVVETPRSGDLADGGHAAAVDPHNDSGADPTTSDAESPS
jgi:hypothetical protein